MAERGYRLSLSVDEDLERLYEWGLNHFGIPAADRYFDGLITRFGELAANPMLGAAVDHIRAGYRRSVYVAHSIYYRAEGNGIIIVRILGRQDPVRQITG